MPVPINTFTRPISASDLIVQDAEGNVLGIKAANDRPLRDSLTPAQVAALQTATATAVWRAMAPGAMPTTRLRMTGTGTVSMDARNREGTISAAVYTASVSGAALVDYAYPGDDAVEFRINLTGTAAVEVI